MGISVLFGLRYENMNLRYRITPERELHVVEEVNQM